MIKNTTFKCPGEDSTKIKNTSERLGMYISEFVNYSLDKNLPIKSIPHFKKSKNIDKIGVRIPDSLKDRILESQNRLTDEIRKVKQWEIILHCVLLQCEKKCQ